MSTLVIDGCPIHYRLHGTTPPCGGPPLVLVHGAGGNLMHWPGELRRLPGRLVVALDLPGHGRSDGLDPQHFDLAHPEKGIAAYAQLVGRFAAELGLGKFVLAGHSMGGAVAQELALAYPEMLIGLVLVATGSRLFVAPELLSAIEDDYEGAAATLANWSQGERSDPNTLRIYLQRLREADPQVLYADYAACSAWDRAADLGRITVPTLVICGDADRMTPLQTSIDLQDRIKSAQLVIVTDAGHMVMLEQPARVVGAVQQFLAALPRSELEDRNPASSI
jgi:pimeloyl-ACP methyl ester carboxylesterase